MPEILEPQKYLASVFIVDPVWGSPARFAKLLAEATNAEGVEVSAMPLQTPAEAPAEVPRVALVSIKQSWQVYASLVRIDVNHLPGRLGETDRKLSDEDFWGIASRLFSRVLDEMKFDVNRIAGVLEAAGDTKPDEGTPDDYVRRRFLSSALPACLADNKYDCEAHVYQRPPWHSGVKNVVLNRIFRIKGLHANTPKGKRNALFVETEYNTVADDPSIRFSQEEIRAFYAQVPAWIRGTQECCQGRAQV